MLASPDEHHVMSSLPEFKETNSRLQQQLIDLIHQVAEKAAQELSDDRSAALVEDLLEIGFDAEEDFEPLQELIEFLLESVDDAISQKNQTGGNVKDIGDSSLLRQLNRKLDGVVTNADIKKPQVSLFASMFCTNLVVHLFRRRF